MLVAKPTFIVAELPEAIAAWVSSVRQELEPGIAHMPCEITLAGSSGVGPLKIGQKLEDIERKFSELLEQHFRSSHVCYASTISRTPKFSSRACPRTVR